MSDLNPTPEFEEKVRKAISVPDANPEYVNHLRNELARRPAKMKPRFIFRPAWAVAFVLVLALITVSVPGVASAIGRLFGYVPDVGLVENTGNLRVLAEPVSVTRDSVTLIIKNIFVYEDRVELSYEVEGIAPFNDRNQSEDAGINPTAFCGGMNIGDTPNKDGDALLKLPDGTLLERDHTGKYPQNVFAMKPVYDASVPADVTELTLVLKCLPNARLGAVPENWEVPFKLAFVPDGTVLGKPVINVNATSEPVATDVSSTLNSSSPQVMFTLERAVQTDAGPIFYIRLNVANPDPAMVTVFPRDVYVIDSQGQKIQLMNNTMYSEDPATVWEYIPTSMPADGVLTLVVADATIKYAPPNETIFSFDAGENPQHDQTWELNQKFDIAGHKVTVESVRAATFTDLEDNPEIWDPQGGPDYPEGSQGFDNGYQFSVKVGESVSNVGMDILADSCGMIDVRPMKPSPGIYYTQLCRNGYPNGKVSVIIRSISVLVKNVGKVVWSPDNASLPATSMSVPNTINVRMALDRIVSLNSTTIFYLSMDMENKDPSLISIMPVRAYLIDSLGQKIDLIGSFTWQPFDHRTGTLFEYRSASKPADGRLTVVVENAVAYYAPLYVEPRQATPEEMSFTFDAGEDPQYGQTWDLNSEFEIAGYPLKVTSARAINWDNDVKAPSYIDGSQGYEYGYMFTVETDPSVKFNAEMDIMSESPMCGLTNVTSLVPSGSSLQYAQLCRDAYPKGEVKVTISQISVLLENTWQVTWTP